MTESEPAVEVYIHGIRLSVKKAQLETELASILHRPPFASFSNVLGPVNFVVYLFKDKQHRGRPHAGRGSLTLRREVANLFLQEYGDRSDSPPSKAIYIAGGRLRFSESRSKPRPEIVDRVLRFPYTDPAVSAQKEQATAIFQSESVSVNMCQFGWYCRDAVFSVEWEAEIVGSLRINEERREFRLEINRGAEFQFVAIRFSKIIHVSTYFEFSAGALPVIFLGLSDPPTFESVEAGSKNDPRARRRRLSHLDINDHERVAAFTSLHLRLVCKTAQDLASFRHLTETANIHNVDNVEIRIERRGLFAPTAMRQLTREIARLRWSVAFQLEALWRNSNLDTLELFASHPSQFLRHFGNKARYWTFYDSGVLTVEDFFFKEHAKYLKMIAQAIRPPDNSTFESLHVYVTPTSILLDGPFPEVSNRVIRSFDVKYHESFLRVSFSDEGKMQYRFDRELDCVAFTHRRVGAFLKKGLQVASRSFDFLAYSQSALKEHAVWHSPLQLPRQWKSKKIIHLDDISTASGKYHFTDGVGTMSLELAKDIWTQLSATRRKRKTKFIPRAYQVRFQGCKGMLSVDYKLKGHVVCLRPSMIKFSAPHTRVVEIARAFDRPGVYYLNRPLIMIMEGLGVDYKVFKKYQDKAVKNAEESTTSLKKFAEILEIHGLGASFKIPSILNSLLQLEVHSLKGLNFYQKMLEFAKHHILRLLKTKARIPIPHAVTVVGVADVHKYLKQGEVFVCTRALESNKLEYIQGNIIISRSPTIHPGDVQVVKAIGKPPPGSPFDHEPLPNTVVFSVLGMSRAQLPEPTDQLSQAIGHWRHVWEVGKSFLSISTLPANTFFRDCDGDTFNIIPLSKLPEFRPRKLYKAAEYAPAEKKLVDGISTMDDVADFVIDYINSDALGIVATNWLLIADQTEEGIFHPDCLNLANLHSTAVDYPKTGMPVPIDLIPKPPSKSMPDWHAPEITANSKDHYPSQRAIGKLFRDIKLTDIRPQMSSFDRQLIKEGKMQAPDVADLAETLDSMTVENNPLVRIIEDRVSDFISVDEYPGDWTLHIAEIFKQYSSELQGLCINHTLSHAKAALLSEVEAVVGTIIAKTSQPRKRADLMASLREKTDFLVRGVKEEILGDAELFEWEDSLLRAWLAFKLAVAEQENGEFGSQSFMWVALGTIFEVLKEMEGE
ncbi:RNA-dependent RNA polymerase [Mycena indigotica]|uniref:RNA-dependent RNA polymerase n=1 Tax=Mycena indigotica TaxID=2126181 RepID=A0A8H6SYJ2_9AGAR|nr:RNA-dependent RNA polymerase [Mycena indigotica]KAF7306672.1 RNA-dependent RNA polymerase [Mycena indigotica]